MAVKKTTRKTSAKAVKKPAARKAATVRKTPAKTSAKPAVKKAPTKAKAAPKKAVKTAAKKTTRTKPATAKISAKTSAAPQPFLKEMENIMTKQPFQFEELAQDAANSSRESVEAFVKSGEIFAKGFEAWVKTATSMAQTAGEKQAEFTKQLMGSKTLNEFAEAQNKIAQANFDQFMTGATQLSEMGVKVLSEASEPLNAQMTKAMAKANKQMAA